eukprot:352365-Chlamydomonas_euryale.AAC.2
MPRLVMPRHSALRGACPGRAMAQCTVRRMLRPCCTMAYCTCGGKTRPTPPNAQQVYDTVAATLLKTQPNPSHDA